MGRGNDNRDRRRGRGDQPMDQWRRLRTAPSSYDRPRSSRPSFSAGPGAAGGPETEAKVKWFNAEKGFGFVELTDGSGEAFLHIRRSRPPDTARSNPAPRWWSAQARGRKGRRLRSDQRRCEHRAARGASPRTAAVVLRGSAVWRRSPSRQGRFCAPPAGRQRAAGHRRDGEVV